MGKWDTEQEVEFTATSHCRILYPVKKYDSKSFRVPEGVRGTVADRAEWETLPGDVPVMVHDADKERNVIVSAREGVLAPVSIEHDPRSGLPVFKHYRGISIALTEDD